VDAWGDIRLKARDCHQRALAESEGNRKRDAIVAAALKLEDLQLQHYQPGTIVGHGVRGFLDRGSLMVYVASSQSAEDEAIVIAHEIGHFKLHRDPRNEVTAIAPGLGGDSIDPGAGRVEGYSSRERKEVQADVFAGEFLCPSDWLREQFWQASVPARSRKTLSCRQAWS
jgi:DNA helicase-2/ATP-dependent DNA helicase PcrA